MTLYYAGIGSRQTPANILIQMTEIAIDLREQGYRLRSGHAPGADQAFEFGAEADADIYLPWLSFEKTTPVYGRKFTDVSEAAMEMAAHYHPSWQYLKRGAKLLHGRNCYQILGHDLDTPCEFVICWTPGGEMKGGTAQALRIAQDYDIPVINLGTES